MRIPVPAEEAAQGGRRLSNHAYSYLRRRCNDFRLMGYPQCAQSCQVHPCLCSSVVRTDTGIAPSNPFDRLGSRRNTEEHNLQAGHLVHDSVQHRVGLLLRGHIGRLDQREIWPKVSALVRKASEARPDSRYRIYGGAIRALTRQGCSSIALRLTRELENSGGHDPPPGVYRTLLSSYAAHGEVAPVRRVLRRMWEITVTPQEEHFTELIKAHAKARDEAGAFEAFRKMRRIGLPVDAFSLAALLGACESVGSTQKVLSQMSALGIERSVFFDNHLIKNAAVRGDWETIQRTLSEIVARGDQPDGRTFAALASFYVPRKNWRGVGKVLQAAKDAGLDTSVTLTVLLKLLVTVGRQGEASEEWVRAGEAALEEHNTHLETAFEDDIRMAAELQTLLAPSPNATG
eukprot:Hpha_TRINITY_DN28288_c0_g1::TRINITY_DN28288_c0_g1_i1::g.116824::m.116824